MLSLAVLAAATGFAASIGAAVGLARLKRERTAFAALVLAPVAAALVFAAVTSYTRAHEAPADAVVAAPGSAATVANSAASSAPVATAAMAGGGTGSELEAWHTEAETLRSAHRFAAARDLYAKIVKATPDDAGAWADLADASAAAAGGDLHAADDAIGQALRVDPENVKALWLEASLELQDKRYSNAAALWQRLLTRLPADSNDARIINANLAEARALAAGQGAGQ